MWLNIWVTTKRVNMVNYSMLLYRLNVADTRGTENNLCVLLSYIYL